ncbi:MAG: amidohydrolase family protein [Brevefilum sp.]|jgi:5-methylthioadenosine/S-adenosylhomocysteine deaminase
MRTLLKNGISFSTSNFEVEPINILIDGSNIESVSTEEIQVDHDVNIHDLNGNLIIPGLIDSHTHSAQSFGSGIYDNIHLTQWLYTLGQLFKLSEEETYLAAQLSSLEAIRSGTTTLAEMTTAGAHGEACIQAIADSGLRADVCMALGDFQEGDNDPPELNATQTLEIMHNLYKDWHGKYDNRITVRVSPVGLPACTEELIRGSRALADELGVGIHTHCSEGDIETENAYERFNMSEVEALEKFGLLGPDCQLVHCIWLTDRDKEIIAEYDCSVVTCPSTNTKITDGMPPMPPLFDLNVNIAIGCDGKASSGTFDMLQEARLVSLLGKVSTMDSATFPAEVIYNMMTKNGRRAIGFETKVGEIKPGYKADLTVIEYPLPHLIDERRLLSNLIFTATGGDVLSVMVDGEFLLKDRKFTKIDEEEVLAKILEAMRAATHIVPPKNWLVK